MVLIPRRMAEILDGIEAENLATEGVTWKEILRVPGNLHRMCIAVTIQIGAYFGHHVNPRSTTDTNNKQEFR